MGIPIDVVPDEEFNKQWLTQPDGSWRGYAAGTPTEAKRSGLADEAYKNEILTETKKSNETQALSDALKLAENKRQFDSTLGENRRQFDLEMPLKQQETQYKVSGGSGNVPKLSEKEKAAWELGNAYQAIDNLLDQGTDPKDIEGIIYDSEADFVRKGLTVDQAILYLNNKVSLAAGGPRSTGNLMEDMQNSEKLKAANKQKEKERLQARPFWQKAIDLLPFEQYR